MTTEQATRAAIVAAVRAFVERVESHALAKQHRDGYVGTLAYRKAMRAELAALERAAAAEGEPEGGSQETDAHA